MSKIGDVKMAKELEEEEYNLITEDFKIDEIVFFLKRFSNNNYPYSKITGIMLSDTEVWATTESKPYMCNTYYELIAKRSDN
jgi:hypothetical protein